MSPILKAAPAFGRRAAVLIGVAALLYGIAGCSNTPSSLKDLARGQMAKLVVADKGGPPPATAFTDAAGARHTLSEFKGKVLVVNLWAKWCAPCLAEIPSLAKLKSAYATAPVAVVAVSLGKGDDIAAGQAFIDKNPPLVFYSEPTYALPYDFRPLVTDLPTTIIYDKSGIERARLMGGADWSGADAHAVIDALVKG